MNTCSIMGRLVRDASGRTINTASGELRTVSFTVAVNRRKKDEADFISCTAWGKTAETIEARFHKGDRIAIVGHIQTGSYEKRDGTKVYTTDVVVDGFDFVETRRDREEDHGRDDDHDPVAEFAALVDDTELPFA